MVDLDTIYERQKTAITLTAHDDPLKFVHRYKAKEDREIAGFLASQFAYGRIQNFTVFLETLFGHMNGKPAAFIRRGDFGRLKGCYHRLHKDADIIMLFRTLHNIYSGFGVLGEMLQKAYCGDVRQS